MLAYLRADGRPGQSPIWYRVDGARFVMTTVTGSPKERALRRDPRICLTVQDETAPYRAVIADGDVELRALPAGQTDDASARALLRARRRPRLRRADRRALRATGLTEITLAPGELRGFDNLRALSAAERAWFRLRRRLPAPLRAL